MTGLLEMLMLICLRQSNNLRLFFAAMVYVVFTVLIELVEDTGSVQHHIYSKPGFDRLVEKREESQMHGNKWGSRGLFKMTSLYVFCHSYWLNCELFRRRFMDCKHAVLCWSLLKTSFTLLFTEDFT